MDLLVGLLVKLLTETKDNQVNRTSMETMKHVIVDIEMIIVSVHLNLVMVDSKTALVHQYSNVGMSMMDTENLL